MIKFVGQFGLICLIAGLIGGWLVQWYPPLLAVPIINLALGFALIGTWIIKDFIPALRSRTRETLIKGTKFLSISAVYSIIVLGVIVYLNFLAAKSHFVLDLTRERILSISEKTIEIAKGLQDKLKIIVPETPETKEFVSSFKDLVKQIQRYTDKIELIVFNPYAKQTLMKAYELRPDDPGVLVLERVGENNQISTKKIKLRSLSEPDLISSYQKLISDRSSKLGYLIGHGEPDTRLPSAEAVSGLIQFLEQNGFEVKPVNLIAEKKLPEDIGALLIIGPQKPLLESEINLINNYVAEGGRVLIAVDFLGEISSIRQITSKVGIHVGDHLIVDPVQMLAGVADLVVNSFSSHAITREFGQNRMLVMPYAVQVSAQSTVKLGDSDSAVIGNDIVHTSKASWIEKSLSKEDLRKVSQIKYDSDVDQRGPIPVAAAFNYYLVEGGKKEAKVVVFGSSRMFVNAFMPLFHNMDIILSSVNWLLDYFDSGAEIPKGYSRTRLPIPENVRSKYILMFLLIPQLIIAFGLYIKAKRASA